MILIYQMIIHYITNNNIISLEKFIRRIFNYLIFIYIFLIKIKISLLTKHQIIILIRK